VTVLLVHYFNHVVAVVYYDGGNTAEAFPHNLWTAFTSPYFFSTFSTQYFKAPFRAFDAVR